MVKISVIVPVYNVSKYLKKCLDSLVNQTLDNYEIVIINDGSTDDSENIINGYLKKHKNIKYYKKENGGQGSARNFGLEKAKGEYISYVDSDDYIETNMLEIMYNKAKKDESDIVICNTNIVDESYKILRKENSDYSKFGNNVTINPNILFDKTAVWNKIYRKKILSNLKFRNKLWYEDLDFSFFALICASKISFVNEYLYNYLLREGSTMNNNNASRNLEIIPAFDEIIKYLDSNKLDFYCEVEFMAIKHLYLGASVRVILTNGDVSILNTLKNYMANNFPNYKRNKYLKKYLSFSKKIVFYLLNSGFYNIIKLLFKVKKR